ncbi:MAG: CARDB domain-containing protein, partial [Phycisphaerae bacterium]
GHSIQSEMLDDVIDFFKANAGEKYVPIEPYEYPVEKFKASRPKDKTKLPKIDIAIGDKDLTVTKHSDGSFRAEIAIYNKGSYPLPQFGVNFYAGDPDKGGRLLASHAAGPIMPGDGWGEYNPRLKLRPGENTISVVVDPGNKVEESDETNNKASQTISTTVKVKPAESRVPTEMVGTWFFDNPHGDEEQMAIFPDGHVVVLYSNGHKDETQYDNGFIELAEYDHAKCRMSLQEDGTLVQYFTHTETEQSAKRWKRIDTQPRTDLLKPLTGPDVQVEVQKAADTTEENKFVAILSNGVTVELVGVCDWPEEGRRCWQPNGLALGKLLYVEKKHKEGKYGFIVKVNGPDGVNFTWNIEGCASRWGSQLVLDENGNQVKGYQAAITNGFGGRRSTNVRVGIASGSWQTVISHNGRGMTTTGGKNILFSQAFETEDFVGITASSPWHKDHAERIVAISKDGRIHTTGSIGSVASGEIDQMTAKFYGLRLDEIAEFQFQTRPYQWITFKNVSLQPGLKTDVQVEVSSAKVDYSAVTVQEGIGFNDIIVGNINCTREFVKSKLGRPDKEVKDEKTKGWWLNYREKYGLGFWLNKNNLLREIRLNEGFKGKLTSGISMSSTQRDVFNIYGRPIEEKTVSDLTKHFDNQVLYKRKGLFGKPQNSKIFYTQHGLLFWFEGDKILQIVIHPKKAEPDVQVVGESPSEIVQVAANDIVGPVGRHALSFDGVDDYLYVPGSPSLTLKPPFTIEAWIKPDYSDVTYRYPGMGLIRKGKKLHDPKIQAGGFLTLLGPPSDAEAEKFWGGLYISDEQGMTAQANAFSRYNLGFAHPGWFYVRTDCTREDYVPVHDGPIVVGDNVVPDGPSFKGEIADIRIWSKVLTDEDIRRYADTSLTGAEPNLVACWDFERPGGQIVYDISPNGNHARLGKSIEADDADPKWIDLKATSLQPGLKTDVQVEVEQTEEKEQAADSVNYAWQRTDCYVLPNPEEFFPDDPQGGKQLDALFDSVDKDRRTDGEILSTVRQGFRRTSKHRTLILSWVGNKYIWNKQPQNPEAVEIMYHAVPMERHYAIYFGLSVLQPKTPNVLRTLAEVCMQGEDVGRITWGTRSQRDELVSYIEPYLEHENQEKREMAFILLKHFGGEIDFEKWKREKFLEQKKIEFADRLPEFRDKLLTGNSKTRREVLTLIQINVIGSLLDDSFLDAMNACAEDKDPAVRSRVASIAGSRWVWSGEENDRAIQLMLKLSYDEDRDTRYKAVYHGLSTVRNKSQAVIRRLVELALADHENNLYGRIVWGLSGPMRADKELSEQILAEQLDEAKSELHHQAALYLLYRDVLKEEPPRDWGLEDVKEHYPEDVFMVYFSAEESFQSKSEDEVWAEFKKNLPDSIDVQRLPNINQRKQNIVFFKIRGEKASDVVKKIIEKNPNLRLGQVAPFPIQMQLFFAEMQRQIELEKR